MSWVIISWKQRGNLRHKIVRNIKSVQKERFLINPIDVVFAEIQESSKNLWSSCAKTVDELKARNICLLSSFKLPYIEMPSHDPEMIAKKKKEDYTLAWEKKMSYNFWCRKITILWR